MFMAFFQVLICIFFVSSLCEILTWQNCFYKSSCTSALSPWRPVIFFIIDHFNHLWTIIIVIHDQARCPQSFSEQCNLLDLIHCQDLLLPGIVYEKVECHFSICKFFYFLTFYNSKSYNVLHLKDRLSHIVERCMSIVKCIYLHCPAFSRGESGGGESPSKISAADPILSEKPTGILCSVRKIGKDLIWQLWTF